MNGVVVRKANYMTPQQRDRSLKSLHLYMQGYTWAQVRERGGYTWAVFSKMMMVFPELSKAYMEARRQSGQSFEDKALTIADKLVGKNEYTGTKVRALEVAMGQYRWSASRRDPQGFAEAGAKQISVVVPIQINSSLNLAQPGAEDDKPEPSVYEVHAEVLERAQDAESDLEVESSPEDPETLPATAPASLEALADALGLPQEVPAAIKKRPSPGRPRKKHKNKRDTSVTATSYARMHKSASVKAALGIKDDEDDGELAGNAGVEPSGSRTGRE